MSHKPGPTGSVEKEPYEREQMSSQKPQNLGHPILSFNIVRVTLS